MEKQLTDKRLRHTQKSLWTTSKENSYTYLSRHFHLYTSGLQAMGSKTDLEKFLNELNAKHPSIKFKYEILKERTAFLDTKIYIKNYKFYTKI